MADYLEWDYDHPKHRQRRRRTPPSLEGEIIEPQSEPRVHRVEVEHVYHHRRSGSINPQRLVIIAAFAILALVLLRSPFGLLMLAVLVPPLFWIAGAFIVAVLAIAHIRNHRSGKPF